MEISFLLCSLLTSQQGAWSDPGSPWCRMVDQPAKRPDLLPVGKLGCLLLCVQKGGKVGIWGWKFNFSFGLLKGEGTVFPLVIGWSGVHIAKNIFCCLSTFSWWQASFSWSFFLVSVSRPFHKQSPAVPCLGCIEGNKET